MKIYWSSDNYVNEGEVTTCVMVNGSINILFKTLDDGGPVQGKISLKPTNDEQTTEGYWTYVDSRMQNPASSAKPLDSEETTIRATVTGKLHNFRGKKIEFVGTWDETAWNTDGDICDFELDAELAG